MSQPTNIILIICSTATNAWTKYNRIYRIYRIYRVTVFLIHFSYSFKYIVTWILQCLVVGPLLNFMCFNADCFILIYK